MSRARQIIATTGILATAGFGSLATATVAGATTSQCASNPFCYTQEVHGTNLVMSVGSYWHSPSGAKVVVEHQSSHSTASDFLDGLAPFPKTTNAKFFEYAPRGRQSGYCVTEARSHGALTLRACNGWSNQAWDAVQYGSTFEWINEATGDAMTDPGHNNYPGNAGTQLTGETSHNHPDQLWDATNH